MDYAEVTLELSPEMQKELIPFFNIEIEVMQGESELLKNGNTRFCIKVNEEKGELIKSFILKVMQNSPSKLNYN